MRKHILIVAALLTSLFIYLFYRTENTVVNTIVLSFISTEKYAAFCHAVVQNLPLPEPVIYALPEGLWVFCITLTSKSFFVRVRNAHLHLVYVPILFAFLLEILQRLHVTNGRFDPWDILSASLFWITANYLIRDSSPQQNIVSPFSGRSILCVMSYEIVYLAHVWK